MPALRDTEDATVEDGTHGAQDALQCVWGPLQVGSAVPGVQARGEPDFCGEPALEFAQEGARDEGEVWTEGAGADAGVR